MQTVQQKGAPTALADMPMTKEGTIDFRRLAVRFVEDCMNAVMGMTVEEVAGEQGCAVTTNGSGISRR